MPYKTIADLPSGVKDNLPTHAAEIWLAAHNAAMKQYDNDEGKSAAVAWAAVKSKFEQRDGKWVAKETKESKRANRTAQTVDIDKLSCPDCHGERFEEEGSLLKCCGCGVLLERKQEVKVVNKLLQEKYSTLIQEYGRKNASADAGRIHKILELCQELLDPIEEEIDAEKAATKAQKVEEAIKEADSALAWLKEQATMKTEDGAQYPAAAFAYAPDPEKSSDWKLRLWEDPDKKVTRAQVGRAAAALSPGGFRGQKVEIPAADLSAVKRKIRAAYRSLDVADEDIPRWVQESYKRTILADFMNLAEATVNSKGVATIVVIRPGFNSSKDRYYPVEVLARDYGIFEGMKMYADHPTAEEDKQRPERSIKDWVATLNKVRVDGKGQIIGEATIVEPWMQQKLAALRDKGMLQEMGISINAVGTATRAEIEGVKTNVIEKLVRGRSVDFVTEAGAGGTVQMYEAGGTENDIDIISLEVLRERRPDLVKIIETGAKAVIMQEVKKKVELEEKVKELEANIATLTTERDCLKTKITEAEKAQRIAEAKSLIDEAISKSNLPEAARKKLTEKFAGAEKADGITEAIKAETDYITALKESGKVSGMGGSKPDPEASHKALVESFKKAGLNDKAAEIAATGR